MKKHLLLILSSILLLSGCDQKSSNSSTSTESEDEYMISDELLTNASIEDDNNRIFYEIFTGSFSDSNNDGIGDLRGIINRLDYLNDGDINSGKSLGVGGIWLTPIFKSNSYHKYDVIDYYTIDPTFGNEQDLKDLISECHKRNVKLILDLPINHTALQNELFVKFKDAHKKFDNYDPYYDYYSYYLEDDGVPNNNKFYKIDDSNSYYEGNFSSEMPELNFDNKEVRKYTLDIAKHYLNLGVDGFRFDAAKYLYLGEDNKNNQFWKWYTDELRKIKSDVYTVGEVWDTKDKINSYYDNGLDCFDFPFSQVGGMIHTAVMENEVTVYTNYVEKYLKDIKRKRKDSLFHPFISNHDMDRCAGYLRLATKDAFTAANLYLLSPGSPFIYYGEEIGLKGNRGSAKTDANRRLAMLWGDDDTITDPVGTTYNKNKQTNGTVADHKKNKESLYNHYKKVIMARNANKEIVKGDYKSLTFTNSNLGGFMSTYKGSSVVVIHNVSLTDVTLDLSEIKGVTLKEVRAALGNDNVKIENNIVNIPAQTSVILK